MPSRFYKGLNKDHQLALLNILVAASSWKDPTCCESCQINTVPAIQPRAVHPWKSWPRWSSALPNTILMWKSQKRAGHIESRNACSSTTTGCTPNISAATSGSILATKKSLPCSRQHSHRLNRSAGPPKQIIHDGYQPRYRTLASCPCAGT